MPDFFFAYFTQMHDAFAWCLRSHRSKSAGVAKSSSGSSGFGSIANDRTTEPRRSLRLHPGAVAAGVGDDGADVAGLRNRDARRRAVRSREHPAAGADERDVDLVVGNDRELLGGSLDLPQRDSVRAVEVAALD